MQSAFLNAVPDVPVYPGALSPRTKRSQFATIFGVADQPFSQRAGFVQPKQIIYRDDLPTGLRLPILGIIHEFSNADYSAEILRKLLDPYRTSPDSEMAEVDLLLTMEWFRVFDLIERIYDGLYFHDTELLEVDEEPRSAPFRTAINHFFIHEGIGWQLNADGAIATRGDESFAQAINDTVRQLQAAQRPTAADHIQSAVHDLSLKPKPNTSGAVAHSTSAVECVLHDMVGKAMTLGKYLDKYPKLFPTTIKDALDSIYGYACQEGARHGKEGTQPSFEEAHFVVTTCSAICALLNAKHPRKP